MLERGSMQHSWLGLKILTMSVGQIAQPILHKSFLAYSHD